MIFAAEFKKWLDVFGIKSGGGGGGSVTSVGTGAGLTGGPITTTGTISLAPIASQSLLANTTGGSAVPIATPLSNFLLAAQNLSNLTNPQLAFENIGLGSGQVLILTDADFTGGVYQLTNPCPNYITALCATPGNTIQLPNAQGAQSFSLSEGPYIQVPFGFQDIKVAALSGAFINTLTGSTMANFTLSDKSTTDGVWLQIFRTTLLNGLSGVVDIISPDSSINIDSSTGQIVMTVPAGAGGTLQTDYTNGSGTITVLNDNSKPFAVGNDETNIFGPYGVYVSATRNLTATPTHFWFHFFEANDSAAAMVQYGATACSVLDNTAGSVSGRMAIGAAVGALGGEVVPFFLADGQFQNAQIAFPLCINTSPSTVDASSMLDILSVSQGTRPFGFGATTDRDAITSPAQGLHFFNTSTNTANVFDSTSWQVYLTRNKIVAGDNITLDTTNPDGSVVINSSGTGPGSNSDYASFAWDNNLISTAITLAATYYPISIDAGTFSSLNNSNFVSEIKTVSSVATPGFSYIDNPTQYFMANFNIFCNGAVASDQSYRFQIFIQHADLSISSTGIIGFFRTNNLIFPSEVSMNGPIQLQTGDFVFIQVQNLFNASQNVITQFCNASMVNVNATAAVDLTWQDITGTIASLSPHNGYTMNSASLITTNMPVAMNYGDSIKVNGVNSGGFSLLLNVGQSFIYEGATGTTSLTTTNPRATVTIRCVVTDTVFQVEETTGGITLV